MNMENDDYDVVIDTLQKKRDILWKMTQTNMENNLMNIMDDIRLDQIRKLEEALIMWDNRDES